MGIITFTFNMNICKQHKLVLGYSLGSFNFLLYFPSIILNSLLDRLIDTIYVYALFCSIVCCLFEGLFIIPINFGNKNWANSFPKASLVCVSYHTTTQHFVAHA